MAAPLHTVNEEVVIDEGIVSPPAPSANQAAEGQKCTGKLTHQHVVAGWREGFSTTEQRPYFYNVYSRESVWALPCPATSPAGQAEKSGTPVDVLAAAVDELTRGEPPKPERAAKSQTPDEVPQASEGGPDCKAGTSGNEGNERRGKKRAFPADPDQEENERKAARFHIGGERYAFVKLFRNNPYINIREYFYSADKTKWIAGKKGINLTTAQWDMLKSHSMGIDAAIEKLESGLGQ